METTYKISDLVKGTQVAVVTRHAFLAPQFYINS